LVVDKILELYIITTIRFNMPINFTQNSPKSQDSPQRTQFGYFMKSLMAGGFLAVILAGADYAADTIQVPLDNQPGAPSVPLKIRVRCALRELLDGQDDPKGPEKLKKPEEPEKKAPADTPIDEEELTPSPDSDDYQLGSDEGLVRYG
jgi:hypothetical protein